ncbi:uncharacterized protein EV422DRAFT_509430 [Fimicolochytrium jonesii]|uniref:uncharacterized protein n=1 Tax=Fimicolochytrium jonesii TaxID=1396493 RepID=UPI0022FE1AAC|nr:uncharacterized protein EV422DRAFT_509430 [Fimicolochytrium jonesii]KAI8816781.1 hypothetical protein EV422DRAFT_509430 [Fimicolochytrium jonesii]
MQRMQRGQTREWGDSFCGALRGSLSSEDPGFVRAKKRKTTPGARDLQQREKFNKLVDDDRAGRPPSLSQIGVVDKHGYNRPVVLVSPRISPKLDAKALAFGVSLPQQVQEWLDNKETVTIVAQIPNRVQGCFHQTPPDADLKPPTLLLTTDSIIYGLDSDNKFIILAFAIKPGFKPLGQICNLFLGQQVFAIPMSELGVIEKGCTRHDDRLIREPGAPGADAIHQAYLKHGIAKLAMAWIASPDEYFSNRDMIKGLIDSNKGFLPKDDCWSTHTHIWNSTVDCHFDVKDKGFTAQYTFGDFGNGGDLELIDAGVVLKQEVGTLTLF